MREDVAAAHSLPAGEFFKASDSIRSSRASSEGGPDGPDPPSREAPGLKRRLPEACWGAAGCLLFGKWNWARDGPKLTSSDPRFTILEGQHGDLQPRPG